ncbi:PTS sugar transporter subunit IIA [Vibrio sp. SS-MA-C1-2]|uniref:PTS sugar transporter subunit IIA n=1 Tax=Vibrio sp. SS-MA-C1-2 TaxID=2908646 RepID=UPI001F3D8E0F|nr:PTS sugar transporter subunit IIA [Vibrio sp. SS-MA-C1-2]UJF17780.1 PTS sugar transporter subunit IIA [Vibrio sp. SS-MA-C1-2]
MLNKSAILVRQDVDSPEEAIRCVGELMVKNGLVEPKYIDGMLNIFHELGPYWVLTPGLAMPHARPEDGAKKSGFALITLDKPLIFGHDEHDPVTIVIGMSATDSEQHIKNIQLLATLLSDRTRLDGIANSSSINDVLKLINE